MTTRISTLTPAMPTVTTPQGRSLQIHRHGMMVNTISTVGYCDPIDADRFAAEIRGALADAYHAGRRDAIAEAWRADALTEMSQ